VKRGSRIVRSDKALIEKLGRNDLYPWFEPPLQGLRHEEALLLRIAIATP
jgi:hypothetical protein